METVFAVKFFGALFAIMNPVTNLPLFLSLTDGATPAQRRTVAARTIAYAAVFGTVVALAGSEILRLFGIDANDLRVAGGLVVLLIGLRMLQGEQSSSHHGSPSEQDEFPDPAAVAFYPLTFPLMVGPGTITTLILFSSQVDGLTGWATFFAIFAVVLLATGVVFALGGMLGNYLTVTARAIMSRLMGLILAAIAVEMIFTGVKALLPGLAG